MQGVYCICVFVAIVFVAYSYKFENNVNLRIIPFAILMFRNTIRIYDFENSQHYNKQGVSYEYNFEPETDDGSLVVLSTDFFLTMTL